VQMNMQIQARAEALDRNTAPVSARWLRGTSRSRACRRRNRSLRGTMIFCSAVSAGCCTIVTRVITSYEQPLFDARELPTSRGEIYSGNQKFVHASMIRFTQKRTVLEDERGPSCWIRRIVERRQHHVCTNQTRRPWLVSSSSLQWTKRKCHAEKT
jgi:hypothetical protein